MNSVKSFLARLFYKAWRRLHAVRCDGGEGQLQAVTPAKAAGVTTETERA